MTATLSADKRDLIRTAATEIVTYVHGVFYVNGVEVPVGEAHLLRNLILASLLAKHADLVEPTAEGREVLR